MESLLRTVGCSASEQEQGNQKKVTAHDLSAVQVHLETNIVTYTCHNQLYKSL